MKQLIGHESQDGKASVHLIARPAWPISGPVSLCFETLRTTPPVSSPRYASLLGVGTTLLYWMPTRGRNYIWGLVAGVDRFTHSAETCGRFYITHPYAKRYGVRMPSPFCCVERLRLCTPHNMPATAIDPFLLEPRPSFGVQSTWNLDGIFFAALRGAIWCASKAKTN